MNDLAADAFERGQIQKELKEGFPNRFGLEFEAVSIKFLEAERSRGGAARLSSVAGSSFVFSAPTPCSSAGGGSVLTGFGTMYSGFIGA